MSMFDAFRMESRKSKKSKRPKTPAPSLGVEQRLSSMEGRMKALESQNDAHARELSRLNTELSKRQKTMDALIEENEQA